MLRGYDQIMQLTIPRRGRPTAAESQQKMAGVLNAARDLFGERGYRAVTMRDVAERASVSTRTLYNRYADKLSLFSACLDVHSTIFPKIRRGPSETLDQVLHRHAVEIVQAFSTQGTSRLAILVYREGRDFPELVRAAESNQETYLLKPLAAFLRDTGLFPSGATEAAKIFIAMAISEWTRGVTFLHPSPRDDEVERHAALIVRLFLHGAAGAAARPRP